MKQFVKHVCLFVSGIYVNCLNINSFDDCPLLQNDLNALVDWSSTWELNFHPSKCQFISVIRKRNPFNFDSFMNNKISSLKSIKHLGIDISSKLDWNTHINNVVKKCNRKLGLIKRTVGFNAPVNVTKALRLTLIRSDLEFGSCLWSSTSRHNVECLKGVQKRATKFIMHYPDLIGSACVSWKCFLLHYVGNSLTFHCSLSVLLEQMTWTLTVY